MKRKFSWKARWRGGEITIEAETLEELNTIIDEVLNLTETSVTLAMTEPPPPLPTGLGCSDAIKTLLRSEWGNQQRTMTEIKNALEANARRFSKGTISGTLSFLANRGDIIRFKDAGKWAYTVKDK